MYGIYTIDDIKLYIAIIIIITSCTITGCKIICTYIHRMCLLYRQCMYTRVLSCA